MALKLKSKHIKELIKPIYEASKVLFRFRFVFVFVLRSSFLSVMLVRLQQRLELVALETLCTLWGADEDVREMIYKEITSENKMGATVSVMSRVFLNFL